ncbi:hypothetical protein MIDIC_330003 [Alphaproteobacteria bacterium]
MSDSIGPNAGAMKPFSGWESLPSKGQPVFTCFAKLAQATNFISQNAELSNFKLPPLPNSPLNGKIGGLVGRKGG